MLFCSLNSNLKEDRVPFHISRHISHFPSAKNSCRKAFLFVPFRGSLTVEAALAVPLFLFTILYFFYLGLALEAGIRFGNSLNEVGKQLAIIAYTKEYAGDWTAEKALAAGVVSGIYAKQDILKKAGDTSGVSGITLIQSDILDEDQMIDLVLNYNSHFPLTGTGFINIPFVQRARIRAWTGDNGKAAVPEGKEGETLYGYVTVNGTVYHKSRSCTHLRLSVKKVSFSELSGLRNNGGGKYYPCERCGGDFHDTVYITMRAAGFTLRWTVEA